MSAPDGDLAIVDTEDEMNYFINKGFGGYDWWIGKICFSAIKKNYTFESPIKIFVKILIQPMEYCSIWQQIYRLKIGNVIDGLWKYLLHT